jgi:hypothetical protein
MMFLDDYKGFHVCLNMVAFMARGCREREIQQGHYYSSHKEEVREMQKLGDHAP